METKSYRLYGYRWVVLAVFMFINLTMQILWIAFAPITSIAAKFYGVGDLQIGFFAMTFMIAFIPLSIPVSWVIDTLGFRKAVSIGAVLMGIFGITRGLAGANYTLALLATIPIAIAQPFLLNAWTKMPAQWFSTEERATTVGLITLSNLVGIALGMVLTPSLIQSLAIPTIQLIYGAIAAFSTVLFLIFAREKPATPPCPPGQEVRALMLDGLKHALSVRDFMLWMLVFFLGMGIFNGVTTWVEQIIAPRGFNPTEAGTVGALMLVGGVLGAVAIPTLSDRTHKRLRYILLGFILAIPGLVGLAFAVSAWLLFVSAFVMGFFLISAGPIGMQYSAEVTNPTPEGTSNGLLQLAGQCSVVFVYIMEAIQSPDGAFTPAMLMSIGLLVIGILILLQMKDSKGFSQSAGESPAVFSQTVSESSPAHEQQK